MNNSFLLLCFVSLLALTAGCQRKEVADDTSSDPTSSGFFEGEVVASWDSDGRKMTLREDFSYVDPNNRRWVAPAGSVVDGASIPPAFWTFVGGPFEGQYRKASVVHDVGCVERTASWEDVHRMFYDACKAGGVDEQTAKILYYAVYHFGPRWEPVVETVVETHENAQGQLVQERVQRRRIVCTCPEPPTTEEIQQVVEMVADDNPAPVELEQMTREDLHHRPRRRRNRRQASTDSKSIENQNPADQYASRNPARRQDNGQPTSVDAGNSDYRSKQALAPSNRRQRSLNQPSNRDGRVERIERVALPEDEQQWVARQVQDHLVNRLRQPEPDTYDVVGIQDGYRVRAWFYERDQRGQPIENSNSSFKLTLRVSSAGEVLEILR